MATLDWINYKGKEICLLDYSHDKREEILDNIEKITKKILQSGKKDLIYLVNLIGIVGNKEILEKFKTEGKKTEAITNKTAVLGITGLKKILFTAYNKFTGSKSKAFDTEIEAKEWLIE